MPILNILLTFVDFYGIITIRGDSMARLVKLFNTSDIYVADMKKDLLLEIVEKAKEFDFIKQLILFGSSLEERCKDSSDIDLIIIGNKPSYRCLDSRAYRKFTGYVYDLDFSQDYDIIYQYDSINKMKGGLKREVLERGVVIYDNKKQ